jgi:hypothetical protein
MKMCRDHSVWGCSPDIFDQVLKALSCGSTASPALMIVQAGIELGLAAEECPSMQELDPDGLTAFIKHFRQVNKVNDIISRRGPALRAPRSRRAVTRSARKAGQDVHPTALTLARPAEEKDRSVNLAMAASDEQQPAGYDRATESLTHQPTPLIPPMGSAEGRSRHEGSRV